MATREDLLDVIQVGNKTYKGIIDYSTTKHHIFYDLTNNDNPKVSMMIIIWRTYFDHLRFSVFKSMYFAGMDIGTSFLLRKKEVEFQTNAPPAAKSKRSVTRVTRR
jgi:hypothetical protein